MSNLSENENDFQLYTNFIKQVVSITGEDFEQVDEHFRFYIKFILIMLKKNEFTDEEKKEIIRMYKSNPKELEIIVGFSIYFKNK